MPQVYKDPKNLIDSKFNYAVIGASNDKFKHGFDVYYKMKGSGFNVYPVNPRETNIQDDPCYPNLTQLRPFPDVVIIAVYFEENEEVGLETLQEMRDMGMFRVWIEPDCESDNMRHFIRLHHFDCIEGFSIAEEIDKMEIESEIEKELE